MSALSWGAPGMRWVAAAVVVVTAIAFALDATRRRRQLERLGDVPQLRAMAASVSWRKRRIKAVLTVLGLGLVALALARPQLPGSGVWRQRGIDVAIVLDLSKSMLAHDVYPSRLARAKVEAEALIGAIAGDRVAVVAFAGGAVHFPLTSDGAAAITLFDGLQPSDLPGGSDLGGALHRARCLLTDHARPAAGAEDDCPRVEAEDDPAPADAEPVMPDDRSRAIVLFTDGGDTEGQARAEVEAARKAGIAVFVVGVGTTAGDNLPELDPDGNEVGWRRSADGQSYVRSRLEEQALRELATAGGDADRFVIVDPRRMGLAPLHAALDELKEGDLATRVVREREEAYQLLLFPGFLCLLVEAVMTDRRRQAAIVKEGT